MSKSFSIEYDSTKKGWVPTQMRVRMLEQDQEGQYNPCSFRDPEFVSEPAGWLSFSAKSEGEVVCADVDVTSAFISEPGDAKFTTPIEVFVTAMPEGASEEQEPISVTCQVQVEEPGVTMGFCVKPDECFKDDEVWLPADENTVLALTVWVEEVDPESGEIYRAPDEDYEFKIETTFEKGLLLCLNHSKGVILPESNWRSGKKLTSNEPVRGEVTVKAFAKNKTAEKEVGKIDIPWVMYAAKVSMKSTFSPELPALPGRGLSVSLELHQEGMDAPLADSVVQFVWADSCKSNPLGKILTESARTDSEGMVEFSYDPPEELDYESGKQLFDEVNILIGEGENPIRLDKTIVIPVAPRVLLVGKAEKKGLEMDPEQQPIEILPEQVVGGKISGNLILPVEMEGGPRKRFGVNFASLGISFEEEQPPVFEKTTGKRGYWNIELIEITQAWKKAKLTPKTTKLSIEPDDNQVFKMVPGEEELETIENFEGDLTDDRMLLYSASFQRSLKFYRYHFYTHLASKKEEDYDLAISGVQILWVAIRGTDLFFRRFKSHEDMVKSRFDKVVGSLINVALGVASASKGLREAGGWMGAKGKALLKWLAESRMGRWIAKGSSWLGSFAKNIGRKVLDQIAPMVRNLQSGMRTFLATLGEVGETIARSLGSVLDDMVMVIDDLAIAVRDKVQALTDTLSASSEHWDELVAWVQKKKTAMDAAAEGASSWVSSFLNAFQEMAESVMKFVGTLFEKLGKLIFKALSGILCWCGKKAQTWLKSAVDWLCEHSETAKDMVEEILKKEMDRGGATENGIEKLIDALLNDLFGRLTSCDVAQEITELDMQDMKMKFNLLGRQPSHVVGMVYKYAVRQDVPRDWKLERKEFSRKVVELSTNYHQYELTTSSIDEVGDILTTIITVGGLGVALIGIVFSGGAGVAVAVEAVATIENVFNISKAALCDIPQLSLAAFLMFVLVIKYDLVVTELCLAGSTGGST